MPYHKEVGYRRRDTSFQAADHIAPTTAVLRDRIVQALRQHGDMTADETAEKIGLSVLSVRPRFTELVANRRIRDTGARRMNASGRNAAVWTVIEHG